jgi:transposase InsO family protein
VDSLPGISYLGKEQDVYAANEAKISILGRTQVNYTLIGNVMTTSMWVSDEIKETIFRADWLEKNCCMWDFKNSTLTLRTEAGEIKIPMSERTRKPCVRRIFVRDNIEVPPRTQSNLPVKSVWMQLPMGNGNWTVEPRELQPGVMIARTLLAQSGPGVCVRVINCNNEPCRIEAGQFLAEAQRVGMLLEAIPQNAKTSIRHVQVLIDNLPEQLTQGERERATAFIKSYAHAFSSSNTDLGRNRMLPHRINTGDRSPVRQPMRRQLYAQVAEIEKNVQELLAAKLIEPTISPWSSNVLLVRKKDGTMRFCVDYRKLNERTVKDSYPLPRLDSCLESLGGNKIFSTLDLRAGYWQTELEHRDAEKTAFITRSRQYKFTVLSMGLMNAPSQFQRLMGLVLVGLLWDVCLAFLDDVIVFSRDFDQHLERLSAVLNCLAKASLKLKASKCQLFQGKVKFLDHVISAEGIATDPDKVRIVEDWPRPRNLHEVRSFLGLASYYRRFVTQFADIARPLHLLTNKGQPFVWGEAQEEAFRSLKRFLTSTPVLASPIDDAGYVLDTDASSTGLGAVLHQWQGEHLRVIGYASRVLSRAERNYSTTRRELLAVIFGFKQFRQFLFGRKFVLRVDHAALTQLRSTPEVVGQAARWLDFIGEYDFDIQHRSGAAHGNCDALSCRPEQDEAEFHCCPLQTIAETESELTPERIAQAQYGDAELKELFNAVKNESTRPSWKSVQSSSDSTRMLWAQYETLCVHQGMLCRKYLKSDGFVKYLQIIMPQNFRELSLQQLHQTGGNTATTHLGVRKTQMHVQQRAYWPGWKRYVDRFCRKCAVCQSVQHGAAPRKGRLQTYEANGPMDRLHIDLTGRHPPSRQGSVYILTAIDAFTRYLVAVPIKKKTAIVVASALIERLFLPFGTWRTIISDQGKEFCNEILDNVSSLLKIHKLRTTVYRPSASGRIEWVHRTINNLMSKMVSEGQKDWQDCLPYVVAAYNAAQHETTGYSPFYLMYGHEYRTPLDLTLNAEVENETSTGLDYSDQLREWYRQAFTSVNTGAKNETAI